MALLTLSRNDKRLVDLPTSWSNAGRHEQLQREAAESFSNLIALAVAKSGANFQLYDALRPLEEQIEMLQRNYRRVSRARYKSSDRTWDGSTWERRPGRPNTASPGWSNHGSGLAVDIHHGPIQAVFKSDGPAWGWSWEEGKRNGEDWHFVYVGGNRYASRGWLDHAWVQRVVGADVDGKIGTGTVAKIKAWQKAHGLEADGIVGPGTKKAMQGKGDAAPAAPEAPKAPGGGAPEDTGEGVLELVPLPEVERDTASPNRHEGRVDPRNGKAYGVKHITVHWWGEPKGQAFDGIVAHLCDPGPEVSAHYVISSGRVAQLIDEDDSSWANGNRVANFESVTIECDPNDVLGTLPVLAALIRDIRSRHGDLPVFPHSHWTSTLCCGDYEPHLGAVDQLARTGEAVVTPPTPETGGDLPEGKELLMALIDAPDFPLLRTPGNLCYYGGDKKQTSVSGKLPNSLVPGEIEGTGSTSGAKGLKVWQARMNERGYSLDVDGRYGGDTEKAARNLQRLAGITQDGKIGPSTFYAAWLLPVI